MSQEIASMWSGMMSGGEIDVDGFVNGLLGVVVRFGNVSVRVNNANELEVAAGSDSSVVWTDAASSKFRMACARLAVMFGGQNHEPPMLYGGSLSKNVTIDDGVLDAELVFKNTPDGWFTVKRRR